MPDSPASSRKVERHTTTEVSYGYIFVEAETVRVRKRISTSGLPPSITVDWLPAVALAPTRTNSNGPRIATTRSRLAPQSRLLRPTSSRNTTGRMKINRGRPCWPRASRACSATSILSGRTSDQFPNERGHAQRCPVGSHGRILVLRVGRQHWRSVIGRGSERPSGLPAANAFRSHNDSMHIGGWRSWSSWSTARGHTWSRDEALCLVEVFQELVSRVQEIAST